jgi:ABC-2 type transport system ATP-binding protein
VGLAKAFLNDPKLLLLDEPAASLDPVIARDLRARVSQRIKVAQGAIVWTSHNMREIEAMCDRIIFLSRGRIIADDTLGNLRHRFNRQDLEEIFITLAGEAQGDVKPL